MKRGFFLLLTLAALLCLIGATKEVLLGARTALALCAEVIVPSLLPFFVLSGLLARLGLPQLLGRGLDRTARSVFGVSGCGFSAFFAGICGGYPLGAQFIAKLREQMLIGREEGEKLLCFCNNSGPAFIFGAVGSAVFGSVKAGALLYGCHVASALLLGLLLRAWRVPLGEGRQDAIGQPFSLAFTTAVRDAVDALLGVCGFIVCFSVLAALLEQFGAAAWLAASLPASMQSYLAPLLRGFLELGSGIGAMQGLPPDRPSLALAAFLLGWGGLSVQMQTLSVLAGSGLRYRRQALCRLFCALVSALLAALGYGLL